MVPALQSQGRVQTWVTSQWKLLASPGHFSVAINRLLTEASRNGATIAKMQEVSRHKKVEVLLSYVRSAELFEDHAGQGFL